MPITPITRPPTAADPFVVHLWLYPGASAEALALLQHPNVRLISRTSTLHINEYKPPGAPDYPNNSAANVAARIADWHYFSALMSGRGAYHAGTYDGSIFIQDWGEGDNAEYSSLMRHPGDAINGNIYTPFSTEGQYEIVHAVNNPTVLAAALRAEFDSRGLAYPILYANDHEESLSPNAANDSGVGWWWPDSLPITEVGELYNGPTLCQELLFGVWTNRTLQDTHLDPAFGNNVQPDPGASWLGTTNYQFDRYMVQLNNVCNDWAMDATLYSALRAQFGRIRCGNYELTEALSAAKPYYNTINPWLWLVTPQNYRLHAEYQAPVLYGCATNLPWPGRYQPDPANPFGQTVQEIWRNFCKSQVDSCLGGGNTKPVIPWTMRPRQAVPAAIPMNVGPDYLVTNPYVVTKDDVLHVLMHCVDMGIREAILWCNDWNDDSGAGATTDVLIETKQLIEELVAYAGGGKRHKRPSPAIAFGTAMRGRLALVGLKPLEEWLLGPEDNRKRGG